MVIPIFFLTFATLKLKADYDGVVIGSGSLEEAKFQVINFMAMFRGCIEDDKDFSIYGSSNIHPWSHNLVYEVCNVRDKSPYEIDRDAIINVKSKVYDIVSRLSSSTKEDLKRVKHQCIKDWDCLLYELTKLLDLKYTID